MEFILKPVTGQGRAVTAVGTGTCWLRGGGRSAGAELAPLERGEGWVLGGWLESGEAWALGGWAAAWALAVCLARRVGTPGSDAQHHAFCWNKVLYFMKFSGEIVQIKD